MHTPQGGPRGDELVVSRQERYTPSLSNYLLEWRLQSVSSAPRRSQSLSACLQVVFNPSNPHPPIPTHPCNDWLPPSLDPKDVFLHFSGVPEDHSVESVATDQSN